MKILALSDVNNTNAHVGLIEDGHYPYYYIGSDQPSRNLRGSPLSEGPTDLPAQYRAWLWMQINDENPEILSALRDVARSSTIVHNDRPDIAEIYEKAAAWYKEKVLVPQIVCRVCLTYLTDGNKGDFHMCAQCAYSGGEQENWDVADFSFFCSDCSCRLHSWYSKMYGLCKPCRRGPQTFVGVYGTPIDEKVLHQKLDRILSRIPANDLALISSSREDSMAQMVRQYACKNKVTFLEMSPKESLDWAKSMVIFWDGDYHVGQFLAEVQEKEIPLRLIEE